MIHAKQIEAINALIFVEEEVSAKVKSYLSDAHRTRRKKIARRQRRMVRVVATIRREARLLAQVALVGLAIHSGPEGHPEGHLELRSTRSTKQASNTSTW